MQRKRQLISRTQKTCVASSSAAVSAKAVTIERREFWQWWMTGTTVPVLLTGGLLIFTWFIVPRLRVRQAKEELAQLHHALGAFQAYHHQWPQAKNPTEFLHALMGQIDASGRKADVRWFVAGGRFNFRAADPNAIDAAIMDPWGHPYRYVYRATEDGAAAGYFLFSAGPDGRFSDPTRWARGMNGAAPEDRDNLWVCSECSEP